MDNVAIVVVIAAVILAYRYVLLPSPRIPYHDSVYTAEIHYDELMNTRSYPRFRDTARMDRETFLLFLHVLKDQCGLTDGDEISGCIKVMIFIQALKGFSIRAIGEHWNSSLSTVHLAIREVVGCLINNQHLFFVSVKDDRHPILDNPKYFPYFNGCKGALDGTFVDANIHPDYEGPFRNRKGNISQNVLGIVDFDMKFTYVLAGWEGSVHDSRVLDDAVLKGLHIPVDGFYLGDAAYTLKRWCLIPYRGVRYHLKEWGRANERPANSRELFNLRHSTLRNVIERSYGVVKKRFSILESMHSYPYPVQVHLALCCFMVHTFIRCNQGFQDIYDEYNIDEPLDAGVEEAEVEVDAVERAALEHWRDEIAQGLWADYRAELLHRGIV